jgi:outer membrane biosynthesis protein TonB
LGWHMATNTKPLKQRSTDELETAIQSGYFDNIQKSEAERILRDREREPDRKLARRTYNAAAWARAYSEGTFIVALIILWLLATGEPPAATSGQAPTKPAEAAKPETSLLAAPPIETAKPETSPPAAPTIAEPKEAPAPPTEAAEPETSPSVAPAEAPLPSPEAHPAEAAPAIASPEEPLATPTPPNAASTEAQPATPADATAPPRQRPSSRPRRTLSAPREATEAWKKGIGIFGQ